ncbi:MAG: restriction endonuclease [Candidatus Krumholzibacteria bacterium]|jgi:restriction system protein|nr:restriction endonuclease [Candidatus Krumholzibacteria bacterium]MDP6669468.1 restriction endonuclease [Candidatus Krumholzibacteria bacterium]MDP6797735.1 restriction endonuclease [Candidatus Krumholzibacteria bacterium]MDP7021127.1 restriction endonuclease [Candidatus Krumholzibacteria bacterium]
MARRRKQDATIGWLLLLALPVLIFQAMAEHPVISAVIVLAILIVARSAWKARKDSQAESLRRMLGASPEELDLMSGSEFEQWICAVLENEGISAENIRNSGDFGIDVIAEVEGNRIGIQAKRYSSGVGNDAVQQVIAGSDYHNCSFAAVVTQSHFTRAAREQASRAHLPLALIDRTGLSRLSDRLRKLVSR